MKNPFFFLSVKAFGIWLVILFCAVLNGALREIFLIPNLGVFIAQILSGVLLSAIILLFSYGFIPRLGILSKVQIFYPGLFWLVLTVLFEFGFGLGQAG